MATRPCSAFGDRCRSTGLPKNGQHELRTPSVANGIIRSCPRSRLPGDLLLVRKLYRRTPRRRCHRLSRWRDSHRPGLSGNGCALTAWPADCQLRPFRRDAAAAPCWTERSCLRSAPEAGTESGYFGGSRTREEADIPRMCRSHRADWPAIDGSGSAPRKKPAVVRRIAAHPRLLAFRMVEHGEHSICLLISGTTRSDSGECGGDGVCFRRARHGLIHYVQRIWS